MKMPLVFLSLGLLLSVAFGCSVSSTTEDAGEYFLIYHSNGATSGTVPAAAAYALGKTVAVAGNPGGLVRSGYSFVGWNTKADGSGLSYTQGQAIMIGTDDLTLYAKWTKNPVYIVTYNGNGAMAGAPPSISTSYEAGSVAVVLGNTGNYAKPGYVFTGWNTKIDGTGTSYAVGSSFTMGNANVTLYAVWKWTIYDVYVAGGSSTIDGFRISEPGTLTSIGSTTATGGVTGLVANAAGTNLYASNNQTFSAFSIGAGGGLSGETTLPIATTESFNEMVILPKASDPNYLYTISSVAGVAVLRGVAVTGTGMTDLGATGTSYYWGGNPCLHPSGKFIYFQTSSGDAYVWYSVNSTTGALTYSGDFSNPTTNITHKPVAMNPAGTYLYIAGTDGASSHGIYYYQADPATGALSNLQSVAITYYPEDVAVHPSGSWLYVAGGDGAIHRYTLSGGTPGSELAFSTYGLTQYLKLVSTDLLVSVHPLDGKVVLWKINPLDGSLSNQTEASVTSPGKVASRLAP